MDDKNDRSVLVNVLAGIGLGAIVGAAVALVMAPKSGIETREDIRGSLDELKSKAEKVAKDLIGRTEELVVKGREAVDTAGVRIREAVVAGRDAITQAREEASESTEEAV